MDKYKSDPSSEGEEEEEESSDSQYEHSSLQRRKQKTPMHESSKRGKAKPKNSLWSCRKNKPETLYYTIICILPIGRFVRYSYIIANITWPSVELSKGYDENCNLCL